MAEPTDSRPVSGGGFGTPGTGQQTPGEFGFGRQAPSPREVAFFHEGADTDQGNGAKHHTLGYRAGQAAPGDEFATLKTLVATLQTLLAEASPAGNVEWTARSTAPTGWLLCDGSAVSRATYATLFAAIGTTYGTGNGSTTFNVPNLKGRVGVGRDSGQAEFDVLGETGGAKTHTLAVSEIPAHSHTTSQEVGATIAGSGLVYHVETYGGTPISTGQAGGGGAHNNLQPYLVLNAIIKT